MKRTFARRPEIPNNNNACAWRAKAAYAGRYQITIFLKQSQLRHKELEKFGEEDADNEWA